MDDSSSIVLIGRLERAPWRRVSQELSRRRLTVQRHLSKNVRWIVVGHGAARSLRSGRLPDILGQAERHRIRVMSEVSFLREIGLHSGHHALPGTLTIFDLARYTGLNETTIQLLTIFDLLDFAGDGYSLRDLKAAKQYAEWLRERNAIEGILATLAVRQTMRSLTHLSNLDLSRATGNTPALPLGDEPVAFDEAWETGVQAWSDSETQEALQKFVQCSQIRPKDAGCLVNLAMALERVGEIDRAREVLERATVLEPNRAEPWIDLAAISHGAERITYLGRAVEADPDDQITHYELANELTAAERYSEALTVWERLDEAGHNLSATKFRRAKKSIALCRLALAVDVGRSI